MNWLDLFLFLISIEVCLFILVNLQRQSFPWLITKRDEFPVFEVKALEKFLSYSFDAHLGWVRKPNSIGTEVGQKGLITFNIDSIGSRSNSFVKLSPRVAVFGDSYAFCRQVQDDETWEAQLSQLEGCGVLNFGVGNYGVDQALLRYESVALPDSVRVVVMCFVPETISRIQSYWKHYLEFGNIFGFKPRFVVDKDGRLTLLENLIRSSNDFAAYRDKLPDIQREDSFYRKKFRSRQFRFPYTFSFLRNPIKQASLILTVTARSLFRSFGIKNRWIENLPFTLVMKYNVHETYRLYRDRDSANLLNGILLRFAEDASRHGHVPLVVVIPQLLDLTLNKDSKAPFKAYLNELAQHLPVLDFSEKFINTEFKKLYINDQYGGHLSVEGNRFVADEISTWLKYQFESNV